MLSRPPSAFTVIPRPGGVATIAAVACLIQISEFGNSQAQARYITCNVGVQSRCSLVADAILLYWFGRSCFIIGGFRCSQFSVIIIIIIMMMIIIIIIIISFFSLLLPLQFCPKAYPEARAGRCGQWLLQGPRPRRWRLHWHRRARYGFAPIRTGAVRIAELRCEA